MATNHIKCIKPTNIDKFYVSTKKGGLSEYAVRDTRTGYTLPNCTAYAEGKFNQEYCRLSGKEEKIYFSFMGNAYNFFNDAKRLGLKTGQVPQEGAMMCWGGGKGHVAIVDEVLSDGTIRICESAYRGKEYSSYIASNKNGRWGMASSYNFLGFIYNPEVKEIILPVPATQDRAYDQVKILKSTLRVRTTPNTSGTIIGLAKTGFYNYTEKTTANGYTWYKVGDFQWMAGVNGTLEDHPRIQVGDSCRTDALKWKLKEIKEDSYVIECSDGYAELKKDKIKF